MAFISRLRPAHPEDQRALQVLLEYPDRVHRHLDWRTPIDLLSSQPYFVIEGDFTLQAALACPEDPEGVAWIRFFAAVPALPLAETWRRLFQAALQAYPRRPEHIVSVAVQAWYLQLLVDVGFTPHQAIVVLYLHTPPRRPEKLPQGIEVNSMHLEELEQVMAVDHAAFAPIWRYSLADLASAYQNSAYATVARLAGRMVGYQISSANPLNAHLARLAVIPDVQGQHIGSLLTHDMVQHFNRRGIGYITVNTQNDNQASLKLYQKLGFTLTNEEFPVLIYPN